MMEVEVDIPVHTQSVSISRVVEQACASDGLTLTLKGSLAKYPGCIHWHFKKGKERGTLEITWWDQENRLWFKVAAGRTGVWIEETVARLKEQIEHNLKGATQTNART
jgi:hypothetical protein